MDVYIHTDAQREWREDYLPHLTARQLYQADLLWSKSNRISFLTDENRKLAIIFGTMLSIYVEKISNSNRVNNLYQTQITW